MIVGRKNTTDKTPVDMNGAGSRGRGVTTFSHLRSVTALPTRRGGSDPWLCVCGRPAVYVYRTLLIVRGFDDGSMQSWFGASSSSKIDVDSTFQESRL
ncbi:hypothetical protein J6590_013467 [Homalodisca vitripennis]|nr:hypothetical protein J6590_013467 [Homalodisca vitripennis]